MSSQPSAKITNRHANETKNEKNRQRRAGEDKGERSSTRYKGAGR